MIEKYDPKSLSQEAKDMKVDCCLFGTDKECRGCSQRRPPNKGSINGKTS